MTIQDVIFQHEDIQLEWKLDDDYLSYMHLCAALVDELMPPGVGKKNIKVTIAGILAHTGFKCHHVTDDQSLYNLFVSNNPENPVTLVVNLEVEEDSKIFAEEVHILDNRPKATLVEIDEIEEEVHAGCGSIVPYASRESDVHGLDAQLEIVDDYTGLEDPDLVSDLHGLEEQPEACVDGQGLTDMGVGGVGEASDSDEASESDDDPMWVGNVESEESESIDDSFLVQSDEDEDEGQAENVEDEIGVPRHRSDSSESEAKVVHRKRRKKVVQPRSIPHYDSASKVQLAVNQLVNDHQHFRQLLRTFAVEQSFEYKKVKCARNRMTYVCAGEGCIWRVHASKSPCGSQFMIKMYMEEYEVACINTIRADVSVYCSSYFTTEKWRASFAAVVHLIRSSDYWPEFPQEDMLQPPATCKRASRPRKHRTRAEGENRPVTARNPTVSCKLCKGRGHNKRRCPQNPNKTRNITDSSHNRAAGTSGTQSEQCGPSNPATQEELLQSQLSQL